MQRLNQKSLPIGRWQYNRKRVTAGIIHFGIGNFHRCHQALYVDKLLSEGHFDWGIIGVSLRSASTRDALAPQDFLYSQVTLDEEISGNGPDIRIIGAVLDILVAPENPADVIGRTADNDIKLVTITITEKGYYLKSGKFDHGQPNILADLRSLDIPTTIYGYLAAAIIQRRKKGDSPLSVVCCDNIQNGGGHLETGVQLLLQHHDPDSSSWAAKHVSFASSMVDKVAPATDESLKLLVQNTLGLEDAWPVAAEPFSQWIIEDKFAAARPAFDTVGAVFSDDITLFEQMKLRFLNAGHSIISTLGYLSDQLSIHQALEQTHILKFVLTALHGNVLPVATLPANFRGEDYIAGVIQRFRNSALPYAVQQVNTDSSIKIQQRWFPTIDDALRQNTDTTFMSFILAAWVGYVQRALIAGELIDPCERKFAEALQKETDIIHGFLHIAGADRFDFFSSKEFMERVYHHYNIIENETITMAIKHILKTQSLHQEVLTDA